MNAEYVHLLVDALLALGVSLFSFLLSRAADRRDKAQEQIAEDIKDLQDGLQRLRERLARYEGTRENRDDG